MGGAIPFPGPMWDGRAVPGQTRMARETKEDRMLARVALGAGMRCIGRRHALYWALARVALGAGTRTFLISASMCTQSTLSYTSELVPLAS